LVAWPSFEIAAAADAGDPAACALDRVGIQGGGVDVAAEQKAYALHDQPGWCARVRYIVLCHSRSRPRKTSKAFFFGKKKQKTLMSCSPQHDAGQVQYRAAGAGYKSLLVLSSEKNTLLTETT
jgi:hypothetical protein